MANHKERPTRPALTDDARENQLIALCVDEAEKQIISGKASSQIITHYLKLGATKRKAELELEILEKQKELITAKTEALKASEDLKTVYADAIKAMKVYSGKDDEE